MRVLHLSEGPLSNSPYQLMTVQRLGGIDARLITHNNKYHDCSNIVYPHDILLQDGRSNEDRRKEPLFDPKEIFDLFHAADVIHCHNYAHNHFLFRLYPRLLKFLKTKKVVLQIHSPRTSLTKIGSLLKNKEIDIRLVVAQYQVRQYPECTPAPNVLPINHELLVPKKDMKVPPSKCTDLPKIPRICYSPSNTALKGWNNKGYSETLNAISKLKSPHEFILIEDTPHEECLRIKQSCDIAIDEVMTGSYHMCSLEAMSQGLVAINAIDKDCEAALSTYTNVWTHPMVKSSPQTLTEDLEKLLKDPITLRTLQQASRQFMAMHWSTEKICGFYKGIYSR